LDTPSPAATAPTWPERYSQRMDRVRASEIRELLKLLDQPDILSFAGGIPDPALFPVAAIGAAYAEVLADPEMARQALQYSVSEGYLPLRQWIARRMALEGVPCEPDNIVLTAGSQQALDLLGKLFLSPGDQVVTARPTYLGALQAFGAYEPGYLELSRDCLAGTEALPKGLARGAGRAAMGYFVPDFANPTGESLSQQDRERLLTLASELDMMLVEDAAYRELRFAGEALPSLLALDIARSGSIEQARTVMCGTFSKTLSPALRMGWICAPRAVVEKIVLLKQSADLHVSTVNQMVTHKVVSGDFDSHIEGLRRAYAARAAAMQAALAAHMPAGVSWSRPEGGMFIWLDLPAGMDGRELLARAIAEQRVAFVPGQPFFAADPQAASLRLSYSLPSETQIHEGVARLAGLIGTG
jgi:DNA-binding transcriptional MocR family regulator